MKRTDQIIQYVTENAPICDMELADQTDHGYLFHGCPDGDDEDIVKIHVLFTDEIFINGIRRDVQLPFHVSTL